MPYTEEHKERTRAKIVESARILFNRHGFQGVTIDMIMKNVGLTRGGFYKHFDSKDALYAEAVASFLNGSGAQMRAEANVALEKVHPQTARNMIDGYLSTKHLGDLDGQCPMIALPSDIAREGPEVQRSYEVLLSAMVELFESNLPANEKDQRRVGLSLAALCVGGMVLARSLPESELADEVREAARATAHALTNN
jgi:AcrR family transcriptional regulator